LVEERGEWSKEKGEEFGVCNLHVLENVMWKTASKRMREAERVARMAEIMKGIQNVSLKSRRKWFTWLILCVDVYVIT
jgi:hypothetical protein